MGKKKNNETFPTLSNEEAEEIVQELGKALDSHREWAGNFRTMLVCRTKPDSVDLDEQSHKKTVFGCWYYGNVNQHLLVHTGFSIVGENSKIMHSLAQELAQTVLNSTDIKPALYQSFVESVDQFRRSIRKLLSEAWDSLRYTDPLTGVMTRTAMQARLEAEQERSRRSLQTCCVGIMDLDNFKNVNDTYGHLTGDKVLKNVAEYVNTHLRHYDQVFRYGGEEFVLLLPNSTPESAKGVLDRLRQGIKRQSVKTDNDFDLHVSASFGVAELLTDVSVDVSIEHADKALYKAKEAGRNKVLVWQSGGSVG